MKVSRRQIAPLLLAIIGPIFVLGTAAYGLEKHRDFGDERSMRNAQRVMNGRVVESGVVATIENVLKEEEPEVIILGNSLSNTDINPGLLARRLGLKKEKVQRFSVPNSLGPHWYAILKNRVYGNGYKPKLVIVLSDLQSLLAVTPRSEASYLNLTAHLSEKEVVIDRKLGRGFYAWERIRENRGKFREQALSSLRNASINALIFRRIGIADTPRIRQGLDKAFDDRKVDMRLHNQVIPIYNMGGKELHAFDPASLPVPRDSFIPNITKLVSDHKGRAVFLRPPMSPQMPKAVGDVVLPGMLARAIRLVDHFDGSYIDMRGLEMSSGHFYNIDHMNNEGARRFTEALAQALIQSDAPAVKQSRRHKGAQIDLLTAVEVVDGKLVNKRVIAEYLSARPPPVPRADREFRKAPRAKQHKTFFSAEKFIEISDPETLKRTPFAARCSPLRVLEDGELLPIPNVTCEEVWQQGKGRTCHVEDRLYFSATDETLPGLSDHEYTLMLDPQRQCEGAIWLYPRDVAKIAIPVEHVADMKKGVTRIRVSGRRMKGPEGDTGSLVVRVKTNDRIRFEESVDIENLSEGAAVWPVTPHIKGGAGTADFIVSNDSDSFVLLTGAKLLER